MYYTTHYRYDLGIVRKAGGFDSLECVYQLAITVAENGDYMTNIYFVDEDGKRTFVDHVQPRPYRQSWRNMRPTM